MEREPLALQPRRHEREQNRGRADERYDANPQMVCASHQRGAGIGYCGRARLRQQRRVLAGEQRREQTSRPASPGFSGSRSIASDASGCGCSSALRSARAVFGSSTMKWPIA